MSEMNGRYERGRWVQDPAPIPEAKQEPDVKTDSIQGSHPPTLTNEMNGRYERGRWVQGSVPAPEAKPEPAAIQEPEVKSGPAVKPEPEVKPEPGATSGPEAPTIEEHMHEASRSVRKAVNDVVNAGHRLLGTPEGHEQIEQAARKAGEDLERAINAWAESARRALQRR